MMLNIPEIETNNHHKHNDNRWKESEKKCAINIYTEADCMLYVSIENFSL